MKKLNKVMSVLLTLAIAASLFVVGAPASAAVGGVNVQDEPVEQAWYGIDLPATYTYVVSGDPVEYPNYNDGSVKFNRIIKMIYNLDESAIYALADIVVATPSLVKATTSEVETISTLGIFKSTNSGRTWTRCITGFEGEIYSNYTESEDYCADIVASNVQSSDVLFTDGHNIYVTRDGGLTWTLIRDLYVDFPQDYPIRTIDYIYNNGAEVIYAGTDADVFILELVNGRGRWDKTQVFENHNATEESCSVLLVKADATSYASNQGVIAVVKIGDDVILTKRFNQTRWNQYNANVVGPLDVVVTTTSELVDGASIWLPDDYATAGIAYVSIHIADGAINPVYKVDATRSVNEILSATKKYAVTNVTGIGDSVNNTIVVGGAEVVEAGVIGKSTSTVLHTDEGIYVPASINPIGVDWAYVLLLSNYGTEGKALAGTAGTAEGEGSGDCGVSLTTDFCDTFIQISMIGEPLGDILDVAGDMYVLTPDILWRNISGYWERVRCTVATTTDLGYLDLEVGTDGTLFIAEVGGTDIYTSEDNGVTFKKMLYSYTLTYPAAYKGISAWYPINKNALVVADNGYICTTTNGGQKWSYKENTAGTITDLIMVDGNWYAASVKTAGKVATITLLSSTDGATWTPSVVATGTLVDDSLDAYNAYVAYAGVPFVVTDFEYGQSTDGTTVTTPTNFLYQQKGTKFASVGTKTIIGTGIVADTYGSGLTSEGTGMVYVIESPTVLRYRGTDGVYSDITTYAGFYNGMNQLWLTKSGTDNVLWAQNVDGVYKYIDTMNDHGTGLNAAVTKKAVGSYDIKFTWDAMDNAYRYLIVVAKADAKGLNALMNISSDKYVKGILAGDPAAYEKGAFAATFTVTTKTEFTLAGCGASEQYYYNVWAVQGYSTETTIHTVYSFAYGNPANKVATPLAGPMYITPSTGYTYEQADNAQIVWMDVDYSLSDFYYDYEYYASSAVAYDHELQIAVYDGNGDPNAALDKAATIFIPAENGVAGYDFQHGSGGYRYSYSPVLDYNTAYAVRVRAVTEDAVGEWSTIVFSTVENTPYGVGENGGAGVVITQTNTSIVLPNPVTVTEGNYSLVCDQPALTVTVPTYTINNPSGASEKASTPVYIWVIIAIGAILCIAVIVLIVRTRRVA